MSLQDVLDFLGHPGAAVRSGMTGNFGGSARHLASIPLDILDAVIPGDVIPTITRPEDSPEFSDVIGGMKPGLAKSTVDILGGMATDPLTYLPPALLAKGVGAAASGARSGLEALGPIGKNAVKGADIAADWAADTFNIDRMTPEASAKYRRVQGQRGAALLAASKGQEGALQGISEKAAKAAVESIHNVTDNNGLAQEVVANGLNKGWLTDKDWQSVVESIAQEHPLVKGGEVPFEEVQRAIDAALKPGIAQRKDYLSRGIWNDPVMQQVPGKGLMPSEDALADLVKQGVLPEDTKLEDYLKLSPGVGRASELGVTHTPYVPLGYVDDAARAANDTSAILPSATKSRAEMADRLASMQVFGKEIYSDLPELLAKRNTAHANIIAKAEAMQQLAPEVKGFWEEQLSNWQNQLNEKTAAGASKEALDLIGGKIREAEKALEAVSRGNRVLDAEARNATDAWVQAAMAGDDTSARDLAVRMTYMLKGMPSRGPVAEQLANWSREFFKKPATTGLGVPNVSFSVRNRLAMPLQVLSEENSRKGFLGALASPAFRESAATAPKDLGNWIKTLVGEYRGSPSGFADDATGKALQAIDEAFRRSGGNSAEALAQLKAVNPEAAAAVENGVLNGYASHEDMLTGLTGASGGLSRVLNAPAAANEAVENTARMRAFLGHLQEGASPEEAARRTANALLDYATVTPRNRAFRDIIPFGAFPSQTLQQVAKSPIALSSAVHLLGDQPDEPVMPFMKDRINIPLGEDATGSLQYLTSLGLPVESVGQVPTGLEDAYQKILGQAHPLLRTGVAALTGEDPVFRSPFMAYDKTPELFQAMGADEHSGLGRLWNLANNSGVTAAAAPVMRPLETLLDDRLSTEDKALRLATGVRMQSVDPDLAEQASIKDLLQRNPDVRQYVSYYQTGDNDEVAQMLEQLKAATHRAKERAKAMAAQ